MQTGFRAFRYARDVEQATVGLYALSDSRSTLRALDLIITSRFLSGPHWLRHGRISSSPPTRNVRGCVEAGQMVLDYISTPFPTFFSFRSLQGKQDTNSKRQPCCRHCPLYVSPACGLGSSASFSLP